MSSDPWPTTTLGAFVDLETGPAFASVQFRSEGQGIPLIRGDNIGQGALRWGDKRMLWPQLTPDIEKYLMADGDVVVGMDGSKVGLNRARLTKRDLPALLVQRVARLRARSGLDQTFLFYLVSSPSFRHYVSGVKTGTSIPHISGPQLLSFPFLLPPLGDQRRIGELLGSLDDKIEVNRRIGQTLERTARALFNSWFVNFDLVQGTVSLPEDLAPRFPNELVDSQIGLVPEGWQVGNVSAIVSVTRETIDPRDYPDEEFDHFSIPAFDADQRPRVDLGSSIKSVKLSVPPDSVLLSKLNPRIPRVWWPPQVGPRRRIASTEFVACLPRAPMTRAFIYGLFTLPAFQRTLTSLVRGTSSSHQRVSVEDLLKIPTVVPPGDVVDRFDSLVLPLLKLREGLSSENRALADLRNTLLPKLISGEVRLDAAGDASGSPLEAVAAAP